MAIIHAYTREQAIQDGLLVPLDEYFSRGEFTGILLDGLRQLKTNAGKFELGELVITANASESLDHGDVLVCLIRHKFGDWGEVVENDRYENERALQVGGPLVSHYVGQDKTHFWIITDAGFEATTVLLPEDY